MLQNIQALYGKKLAALDGDLGHVRDFYFDDTAWAIRYVVVDTGIWLTGRLVLLSPHAFEKLDQRADLLQVKLRKQQIQDSPSIAAHETVSQQFEEHYYRSYGWPAYWQGGQMWGINADPLMAIPESPDIAVRRAHEPRADRHLQSTKTVTGYEIQARDGIIGHVTGFHVNPRSWAIHELVVETGHWYSGKPILISPNKIQRISLEEKRVLVTLTMADIERTGADELAKASPGIH